MLSRSSRRLLQTSQRLGLQRSLGRQSVIKPVSTLKFSQKKFGNSTFTPPSSSFIRQFSTLDDKEEFSFQAETSQLLNIVTHSLYTDKEVFLRELISNAADALEKVRHVQVSGQEIHDPSKPLEIRITTDKENRTLTIEDAGIGLSKQEMVDHLGTIARSGSKAFLEQAKNAEGNSDAASNIIGQFGVGFYSAFMVGDKVEVYSKSAVEDEPVHRWTSSGIGAYTIDTIPADEELVKELRGTKIVIHLRDDQEEYATVDRVKNVINRYSNFVGYPIFLDDERVNTMEAIWTQEPSSLTDEQYNEFYKFSANAFDEPLLRLHFRTDAPIDLKTLIYVPSMHTEKYGMQRMSPGVSIYSRKVLLEANSEKILPGWMRFVRGVVDSEDLPLSISREGMQDSQLLQKINRTVTRKIIRHLQSVAKKDQDTYNTFFAEFGNFLKEGVCTDFPNQQDIAKLLRFNSSNLGPKELTSFDEYIGRLAPNEDKVYYLSAPNRELALASPYYEVFKANNVEVLFLHHTMDDFVMSNLQTYNGRQLVAAESGLDMKVEDNASDKSENSSSNEALPEADAEQLKEWMLETLSEHVSEINTTTRLVDSPAIVVDHESAALRRMMKMVNQETGEANPFLAKQRMEINIKHPIIKSLNELRNSKPKVAATIARQIFDNGLISAGLVDDPREMVPRLNGLLVDLISNSEESK